MKLTIKKTSDNRVKAGQYHIIEQVKKYNRIVKKSNMIAIASK